VVGWQVKDRVNSATVTLVSLLRRGGGAIQPFFLYDALLKTRYVPNDETCRVRFGPSEVFVGRETS